MVSDERAYFEQFSGEEKPDYICPFCGEVIPHEYAYLHENARKNWTPCKIVYVNDSNTWPFNPL